MSNRLSGAELPLADNAFDFLERIGQKRGRKLEVIGLPGIAQIVTWFVV